jgi:hypothetical protein
VLGETEQGASREVQNVIDADLEIEFAQRPGQEGR